MIPRAIRLHGPSHRVNRANGAAVITICFVWSSLSDFQAISRNYSSHFAAAQKFACSNDRERLVVITEHSAGVHLASRRMASEDLREVGPGPVYQAGSPATGQRKHKCPPIDQADFGAPGAG